MGFDFSKAVSVIRALKGLYSNQNNEVSYIIGCILGNKEGLENLLTTIGESIITDLQNIYAAMQQNNLIKEWSGIASTLNYTHDLLKTYHSDLSSVSSKNGTFNGMITVDAGAKQIKFSDWCLGCVDSNGTVRPSALKQLDELINSSVITNPSISSLSGIFSTATPAGGSGTLGADAVSTWASMVLLAKENNNVTSLSGSFKDETQYESMIRLMDYTFALVSMTLYLHDTALLLLIASTGSNSNNLSLIKGIQTNFGSYSDTSSVWGTFASEFNELSTGNINQQAFNNQSAYTVDPATRTDYNQVTRHIASYPTDSIIPEYDQYAWALCSNQISIAGNQNYPNSFFGSLGLTNLNPEGSPNFGEWLYLAVQGTVVSINDNMQLSTNGLYPSLDFYNNPWNWGGTTYTPAIYDIGTFEGSYVTPPVHENPDHISVITGFQLVCINNGAGAFNLALALQFGVLDVSDPTQPVVSTPDTTFYAPSYTQALGFQDYVCTNQSGNYDNTAQEIRPAILTNAALCRLTNGINAINVQAAPQIYKAGFLQPASLKSPLPNEYVSPQTPVAS
ncbi:MAG: hypothetical protein IM638_13980 [Bacteroidetes bacterium]|nr:hypothetical protein [Bacteroidota bacterium]